MNDSDILSRPIDEVIKDQERAIAENPSLPTRFQPIFRWEAAHRIEAERQRFQSGDRMALFAAIRICASTDMVMPEWVSNAFIEGYDSVLNCHKGSWDGAFGKPYKKGTQLTGLRQRREKKIMVYMEIREILSSGKTTAIDNELFERVGKKFGIGKTLANELYYEGKKTMDAILPPALDPADS